MKHTILFIAFGLFCMASRYSTKEDNAIKYVALGDSYTIGEGAKPGAAWPVLLTKHLMANGIDIELLANPSRTGWTTQDLIDKELPICVADKPGFVTLMIGVNDWVQRVDIKTFQHNLVYIIDKVEAMLKDKSHLILITIPDFSVTPAGPMYSGGRNIAEGISRFNDVIKEEAAKRKLQCVDVFPETQKMKENSELIASDGLHPSAKEYAIWEKLIYPVAYRMLKGK